MTISRTYCRLTGAFVLLLFAHLSLATELPKFFFKPSVSRSNAILVSSSIGNGNDGLSAWFVRFESGLAFKFDSANRFSVSIRYGRERLRFEKELAPESYFFYHLRNHTLALCTEIASPITERYKILAGLNLSYLFASTEQGSGVRNTGYTYILAIEENKNRFDLRPHIGIEKGLGKKQKKAVSISCELSLIGRNAQLKDALISSNFPEKYYTIRYSTLFFSAAYRF